MGQVVASVKTTLNPKVKASILCPWKRSGLHAPDREDVIWIILARKSSLQLSQV